MFKSYYSHFGVMFFIHAMVLMGTWQLSTSEELREKLGQGVLRLKVASDAVSLAVQKKVERVIPQRLDLPAPKPLENLSPKAEATPEATEAFSTTQGSEFGTAKIGRTDLRSLYKAELRGLIDRNKFYPTISKRLGHEGTVVVSFTLLEDGSIIDLRIDSPSRYEPLNTSALEAVKKVKRFKPIPQDLGETKMDLSVPVSFKLI